MRSFVIAVLFISALSAQTGSPRYSSRIMIYDLTARSTTLVYRADGIWEAPNWSRDGTFLLSNSNGKLYRIPVGRAPATPEAVILDPAYDDGPDYSRDGKWIYFNSNRGGGWNIWRIPADGAGADDRRAQQVTDDDLEDWFPHPSPDGRLLLFLSFPHGTEGHNER